MRWFSLLILMLVVAAPARADIAPPEDREPPPPDQFFEFVVEGLGKYTEDYALIVLYDVAEYVAPVVEGMPMNGLDYESTATFYPPAVSAEARLVAVRKDWARAAVKSASKERGESLEAALANLQGEFKAHLAPERIPLGWCGPVEDGEGRRRTYVVTDLDADGFHVAGKTDDDPLVSDEPTEEPASDAATPVARAGRWSMLLLAGVLAGVWALMLLVPRWMGGREKA